MEQKKFTDEELDAIESAVIKAQKGDASGFEYLYEFAKKNCYYAAVSNCSNRSDAEDVFQDAFIKIYQNINKIKNPRAFVKYMNMAITRKAWDKNAKADNSRVSPFSDMEGDGGGEEHDFLETYMYFDNSSHDYGNPEANIEAQERKQLLDELYGALSDDQKICINAQYIQELKQTEIADALGVSVNTVKSRVDQGKKKLNRKYEEMKGRGVEFFGLAPIAFIVFLSKSEAQACEFAGASFAAITAAAGATKAISTTGAASAAKSGITVAGKTVSTKTAAIIGAAVIGAGGVGAGVAVYNIANNDHYQRIYVDFDSDDTYIEYIFDYKSASDDEYYWTAYLKENGSHYSFAPYQNKNTKIYAKMYDDIIYFATPKDSYDSYNMGFKYIAWI